MTYIELAEACSVYNCCESVALSRRRANHASLAAFAMSLNRFRANYKEELSDEYLESFHVVHETPGVSHAGCATIVQRDQGVEF